MSPSRDQWILAGILLLGAVAMAIMSRDVRTAVSPSATPLASVQSSGAQTKLRLLFTGDSRGYIKPCGCSEGFFGGLARRATLLAAQRTEQDVLIDLGNLVIGTRPHDLIKLRTQLEALELMRYDIFVPGGGELRFGEQLEQLVRELDGVRTICANLVNAETGEPVFDQAAVIEAGGQGTVAVIGLASPTQKVASEYRVLEFDEVLPALIEKYRAVADRLVIAGHIKGEPALQLTKKYPGVDLVVGSWVPSGSDKLIRGGASPVLLGGERCQYVFWAQFGESPSTASSGQLWLADDVSADAALAELVRQHDTDASKLGPTHKERVQSNFRRLGRAPSESCASCHKAEHEAWSKSSHAHAMETLSAKGSASDPNCLACHYQDVETPASREVRGIGCSACHSDTAVHVQAMTTGVGRSAAAAPTTQAAKAMACTRCHNEPNSPQFGIDQYWKAIAHGSANTDVGSR